MMISLTRIVLGCLLVAAMCSIGSSSLSIASAAGRANADPKMEPPAELDCTYSINPTSRSVPLAGATGTVAVTTADGCSWTAVSDDFWVVITLGASGTGSGTVAYFIFPNSEPTARVAVLTIAGQPFTISQPGVPPLAILASSLSFGIQNSQYIGPLSASGGTPPYQWSVTEGALPGGLELGADTGVISGTPVVAGTFAFTARVTDTGSRTSERAFSLTVYGPDLQMLTNTLPAGVRTVPYATQLLAAGGLPPYSFSVSGLPLGLGLDPDTGAITGTPTVRGTFLLTARVTDGRFATTTIEIRFVIIEPEDAPRINNVKLKANGKLIVIGKNYDPLSAVMIDGVIARTNYGDANTLTVKGVSLASGDHEIRVVAANGIVTEPFILHR